MNLSDRYRNPNPQADSSHRFDCRHYHPLPGSKRCQHYLDSGACALPDELMCVEWLKANGHTVSSVSSIVATPPEPERTSTSAQAPKRDTDLLGYPLPETHKPERTAPRKMERIPAPYLPSTQVDISEEVEAHLSHRGFTTEDIDGFKHQGFEVHVQSEAFGDFWLVPEYTGQDRLEITPEHAATISQVLQVFPDSRVQSFAKPFKQEKEAV